MMDISSPQLAEKIQEIKDKAISDKQFMKELLSSPNKVFEAHGVPLGALIVDVEDIPGYGLYIGFKFPDNQVGNMESKESSAQTSFSDFHFMDCHNH